MDLCEGLGYGARRLEEASPMQDRPWTQPDPHGIDMENLYPSDIDTECLTQEYDMSLLVVEGHLFMSALPTEGHSECPSLVAVTSFRDDEGGFEPTKRLAAIGSELVEQVRDRGLHLGTLQLGAFLDAFQEAMVTVAGEWSVMGNNCSVFVQSMLQLLDYDLTSSMKDFVVDQLMTSESMIETMEAAMEGDPGQKTLRGKAMSVLLQMGSREMVSYVVQYNIDQFEHFLSKTDQLLQ